MWSGTCAEWVSGIATASGTLVALYFGLRKPKPIIEVDYVANYKNDNSLNYFHLTFLNISQVNTAIRLRGVSVKKKGKFGFYNDDEDVEFKYNELHAGSVLECDITNTFRRELEGTEKFYVCYDYGKKRSVVSELKLRDKQDS